MAAVIHLDTSFLIRALIPETPEEVKFRSWLGEGRTLSVSSVAWTEFLCGPLRSGDRELADCLIERRQDFTLDHAALAARLFNESGRQRRVMFDCMIGAIALADGAPVATSNPRDFSRFVAAGLELA